MSRVERESTRNSGLFDSPMGVAWYKKYLNSIIGGGFSHGTEICSPDNQCTNVWCDDTSNCKTKDLHSALCEAWPDAFCNYDGFVEPPGYNPLTAYVSTPTQALMNGSGGTIPISGNLFSFKPQWVKINLSSVDRVNKNLTISMAGSNFDGRIFAFRDINNIYFPYIESNLLASPDIIGWGKHCGGHGFDNTCDRGASAPIRSDWYMDDPCVCTDTYDYPNIYSQNPDCAEKNPTEYGSDYFGDKINWTYPVYGTRLYNGSGEYDDCGCAYFDGRGALDGGFVDCSGSDSELTIPLNGDGYSGIEQGIRNYIWVAIHAGWDDCDWATDLNEMYGLNPPIVAPTCGDFKLHYWIHDNSGNGIGPTPTPTPTPTPGHDMMTHHIPT
jgi:hypothetical protein